MSNIEEGGPCPECGAKGLEFKPSREAEDHYGGCACFHTAPCGYCMSITLACEACGFKEEEP